MNKKGSIAILVIALFLVCVLFVGLAVAGPKGHGPKAKKACNDKIDNDGDNYTDYPDDPGCSSRRDNSELNPNVECDDGTDNDGDNAIDYNDEGCTGPTDNDETNCGDGVCEGGETPQNCQEDCGFPDSCSDTDWGWNIETAGNVTGYLDNEQYEYDDYCTDNTTLIEYYCSGDYANSGETSCTINMTTSCSNGACV